MCKRSDKAQQMPSVKAGHIADFHNAEAPEEGDAEADRQPGCAIGGNQEAPWLVHVCADQLTLLVTIWALKVSGFILFNWECKALLAHSIRASDAFTAPMHPNCGVQTLDP